MYKHDQQLSAHIKEGDFVLTLISDSNEFYNFELSSQIAAQDIQIQNILASHQNVLMGDITFKGLVVAHVINNKVIRDKRVDVLTVI